MNVFRFEILSNNEPSPDRPFPLAEDVILRNIKLIHELLEYNLPGARVWQYDEDYANGKTYIRIETTQSLDSIQPNLIFALNESRLAAKPIKSK